MVRKVFGFIPQPFIAALRRTEAEESAPDASETILAQRAKTRVLRFIFSANRTLWFSACELGFVHGAVSSFAKATSSGLPMPQTVFQ